MSLMISATMVGCGESSSHLCDGDLASCPTIGCDRAAVARVEDLTAENEPEGLQQTIALYESLAGEWAATLRCGDGRRVPVALSIEIIPAEDLLAVVGPGVELESWQEFVCQDRIYSPGGTITIRGTGISRLDDRPLSASV